MEHFYDITRRLAPGCNACTEMKAVRCRGIAFLHGALHSPLIDRYEQRPMCLTPESRVTAGNAPHCGKGLAAKYAATLGETSHSRNGCPDAVAVSVFGTATTRAGAAAHGPSLSRPAPGLVVSEHKCGFRADLTASREAVSRVRAMARAMPARCGTAPDLAETAELVVSELTGNAVRAGTSDEAVPLVVEVHAAGPGIEVIVHDTDPGHPSRGEVALDSAEAETGRGLGILEALTDNWSVEPSAEPSFAKKIRCMVI